MSDKQVNSGMRSVIGLVIALVVGVLFLLTPVKSWLNSHPVVIKVLFPVMLLYTAYGLVQCLREKETWRSWLAWSVACSIALLASLWAFGAGVIFHTLGRYAAMLFVALEVLITVSDVLEPDQNAN